MAGPVANSQPDGTVHYWPIEPMQSEGCDRENRDAQVSGRNSEGLDNRIKPNTVKGPDKESINLKFRRPRLPLGNVFYSH